MIERLLLASASPVRARLLAAAGLDVEIKPAPVDEGEIKRAFWAQRRTSVDCALALAEAKARCISARHQNHLVIGTDQILVCGGLWFDKPSNFEDARAQLRALAGRTHELVTAACVVQADTRLWQAVSRPQLTMRAFSDGFLSECLDMEGAAILGSVGAYRLEGRGVQLFSGIEGDYFAILGLPLLDLLAFLRDRGVIAA